MPGVVDVLADRVSGHLLRGVGAQQRLQFGKPIGSFQLVQDLLAKMLANITACQCMVGRMAQLQAQGKLSDAHAALSKAFTTARMRETVAWVRSRVVPPAP